MSVQFPVSGHDVIAVKITGTTATTIAGSATQKTLIDWVQFTEILGNTPNLTIELYDGTTSYYLRNLQAMTAKQAVLMTQGISLNRGMYLRATSSVGNSVDVTGVQILRTQ